MIDVQMSDDMLMTTINLILNNTNPSLIIMFAISKQSDLLNCRNFQLRICSNLQTRLARTGFRNLFNCPTHDLEHGPLRTPRTRNTKEQFENANIAFAAQQQSTQRHFGGRNLQIARQLHQLTARH